MKRINEIFSDYKAVGNIDAAIVESVVLSKKSKTLEMKINSDKYIEISEFEYLNKFIRKRFALDDSIIAVKYSDGTEKKPIEDELENIVLSVADKYPALKAVMNSSEYEVAEHNINFNFKMPVSGFLKSMEYDKKIHKAIKNLYGTAYKINFVDNISSEEWMKLEENTRPNEILFIQNEAKAAPVYNTPQVTRAAVEVKPEVKAETDGKKGDPSLILGRNAKIKEHVIKITDITPDEGRIALEGEISNLESKELKSGKNTGFL